MLIMLTWSRVMKYSLESGLFGEFLGNLGFLIVF